MIKIIIGYVLDLIIGDPNNPYHPIRYIGKLASNMEKLWRKVFKKNLKIAGFFAWLFISFISSSFLKAISLKDCFMSFWFSF